MLKCCDTLGNVERPFALRSFSCYAGPENWGGIYRWAFDAIVPQKYLTSYFFPGWRTAIGTGECRLFSRTVTCPAPGPSRSLPSMTLDNLAEPDQCVHAKLSGKVRGPMCSYNSVNGVASCSNDFFNNQLMRKEWGLDGEFESACFVIGSLTPSNRDLVSERSKGNRRLCHQ